MKYLIMLMLVIGLALSDIVTGLIKAHVLDDYCSKVMRKGGLNKLAEVVVMMTACGLEIGIRLLGQYYEAVELSAVAGAVAAISVFLYIVVMELISIFENFAAMNPNAPWAQTIARKLRNFENHKEEK